MFDLLSSRRTSLACLAGSVLVLPVLFQGAATAAPAPSGSQIMAMATQAVKAKQTAHIKGFIQAATWVGAYKLFAKEWLHTDSTVAAPFQASIAVRIANNFNGPVRTERVDAVVRGGQAAYRVGIQGGWHCYPLTQFTGTVASLGNAFGVPGLDQQLTSTQLAGTETYRGRLVWRVTADWPLTLSTGKETVHATFLVDQTTYLIHRVLARATGMLSGHRIRVYFSSKFSRYGDPISISWPGC